MRYEYIQYYCKDTIKTVLIVHLFDTSSSFALVYLRKERFMLCYSRQEGKFIYHCRYDVVLLYYNKLIIIGTVGYVGTNCTRKAIKNNNKQNKVSERFLFYFFLNFNNNNKTTIIRVCHGR